MSNSIYRINKGINKSIEFRGLKAQYIWYFGGMIVLLMIIFAILYITGTNAYVCIVTIGLTGTAGTSQIFSLSHKYGEHGLMKMFAKRRIPRVIKSNSRKPFCELRRDSK
ncbi:MAG: DUF4133 domain-containing protein [Sphingobacteriales bacterium]